MGSATVDVVPMAVTHLPPEVVREWVARTCAAQGVPLAVSDPGVVSEIVVLLSGEATGPRRQALAVAAGPGTQRLDAPDRFDPVGVNPVGRFSSFMDDDVVDELRDNRGLSA
jgi:hypothetical protein